MSIMSDYIKSQWDLYEWIPPPAYVALEKRIRALPPGPERRALTEEHSAMIPYCRDALVLGVVPFAEVGFAPESYTTSCRLPMGHSGRIHLDDTFSPYGSDNEAAWENGRRVEWGALA